MGFIKNYIDRKVRAGIDSANGLGEFEKTVLKTEYADGNISAWELKKASRDKEAREELKRECESFVINSYAYGSYGHYVSRDEDGKPVVTNTGYKPINAGVYWVNEETKPGFILQRHIGNGRYRILDDEGYWYGSGNGEMVEKFHRI